MTDFNETNKNNTRPQKELELVVDNYSNESHRTQPQIANRAKMGKTLEVMDKEIKLNDKKIRF